MRVLHVFTRLNAGGPARQALDLLPRLEREGIRNLLAVGACSPGEPSWEEEALRRGIHLVRIPGLGKGGKADVLPALAGLGRVIDGFRPDLVHTNMARAGALGRAAALAKGVPLRIHTFHGHVFEGYFSPARSLALRMVEALLALVSTGITAVSSRVKEDLVRLGVARERKITVLEPCLDLAPFRKAGEGRGGRKEEDPPGGKGLVVGWAGRLVPVKDPFLFAEVAGLLARRFPGTRFPAAGGGPLLQEVRPIPSPVEWLGHVEDMPSFLAGLDLLVLTSRNEGLPLAAVEAMAAGVPVVAPPVGGVPDLLEKGCGGLVAASRKPEDLAGAAASLLGDREALALAGARSRERALFFDLSRGTDRFLAFYRRSARHRKAGPGV